MKELIKHSLKDKKYWFILSAAVTLVLGVVLPLIFRNATDIFPIATTFITGLIVIVGVVFDLSFLNDGRKVGYYLSKPTTLLKNVNVVLITNVIFLVVIYIISYFVAVGTEAFLNKENVITAFYTKIPLVQTMFALFIVSIFVLTLSAEVCGNTIVSVIVGGFIFALPIIVYLLASYIFYILDSVIVGINPGLVVQEVIFGRLLPLDKIYFTDYGLTKNVDIFYFLRLMFDCGIVYVTILVFSKNRKNERAGNKFIINSGFKYFMVLFASMVAPMAMTVFVDNYDINQLIFTLVLLSALSYYIFIIMLDKSFKISVNAIKIYVPFIAIVVILIYGVSHILNIRADIIPKIDEVAGVCINDNIYYHPNAKFLKGNSLDDAELLLYEDVENIKEADSIVFLEDKSSIEKVLELHKELIKYNKATKEKVNNIINIAGISSKKIKIMYCLNNGQNMVREYNFPYRLVGEKDKIAEQVNYKIMSLAREEEFINRKFKAFVDENISSQVKLSEAVFVSNGNVIDVTKKMDFQRFASLYIKDYKDFMNNTENAKELSSAFLYMSFTGYNEYDISNSNSNESISLYYETASDMLPRSIDLGKFTRLRQYLNSLQ